MLRESLMRAFNAVQKAGTPLVHVKNDVFSNCRSVGAMLKYNAIIVQCCVYLGLA